MARQDEAWARVRAMRPLIEDLRAESDRLRRLPDEINAAYLDANLYRLLVPQEFGGEGLDPLTYFDLSEELAYYDGSAGWNFALASTTSPLIGALPLGRLREIFETPDCAIAGTVMPAGRAAAAKDGYLLTGRWNWMSGIHHAKWVVVGTILFDGDKPRLNTDGTPMSRQFILPKDQNCVLDVWHVGGMRGTGSTDYAGIDLFAPADMMFEVFSGRSNHPDPIFLLPFTFFGLGLCAVALGVARSALDGLKTLAITKTSAGSRTPLREQGHAQYAVSKAEALIDSARLNVRASFEPVWKDLQSGTALENHMKARVRRSYVHAAECSLEAVQLCYRAAGGTGLFESAPFERALRDVNAVACHVTMQRYLMEDAGRVSFGMKSSVPFF